MEAATLLTAARKYGVGVGGLPVDPMLLARKSGDVEAQLRTLPPQGFKLPALPTEGEKLRKVRGGRSSCSKLSAQSPVAQEGASPQVGVEESPSLGMRATGSQPLRHNRSVGALRTSNLAKQDCSEEEQRPMLSHWSPLDLAPAPSREAWTRTTPTAKQEPQPLDKSQQLRSVASVSTLTSGSETSRSGKSHFSDWGETPTPTPKLVRTRSRKNSEISTVSRAEVGSCGLRERSSSDEMLSQLKAADAALETATHPLFQARTSQQTKSPRDDDRSGDDEVLLPSESDHLQQQQQQQQEQEQPEDNPLLLTSSGLQSTAIRRSRRRVTLPKQTEASQAQPLSPHNAQPNASQPMLLLNLVKPAPASPWASPVDIAATPSTVAPSSGTSLMDHIMNEGLSPSPCSTLLLTKPPAGSAMSLKRSGHLRKADPTEPVTGAWKKGDCIGSGSFGSVFRAQEVDSGRLFAVKQAHPGADDKDIKKLQTELDICSSLKHPNIVSYLGHQMVGETLCLFMEYLPGGSVSTMLKEYGPLKENLVRKATDSVLQGLYYLHTRDQPVVHRDIKAANLLVDTNFRIKLADFGCSKQNCATTTFRIQGSVPWMAPEVLLAQDGFGRKADVWSLGCTVLEMCTGQVPWGPKMFENVIFAMREICMSDRIPDIPEAVPTSCAEFIKACLLRNPLERPWTKDLLEHAFLK